MGGLEAPPDQSQLLVLFALFTPTLSTAWPRMGWANERPWFK